MGNKRRFSNMWSADGVVGCGGRGGGGGGDRFPRCRHMVMCATWHQHHNKHTKDEWFEEKMQKWIYLVCPVHIRLVYIWARMMPTARLYTSRLCWKTRRDTHIAETKPPAKTKARGTKWTQEKSIYHVSLGGRPKITSFWMKGLTFYSPSTDHSLSLLGWPAWITGYFWGIPPPPPSVENYLFI